MKVINDLYDYVPYKIIQDEDYFKFSLDSILLAEFVEKKYYKAKIMDFCTGNGVVPLILEYYNFKNVIGVELQKEIYDLAQESIKLNNKNITIYNYDVNDLEAYFKAGSFDIITCNPPYFKKDSAIINNNDIKTIARHEIKLTLQEIVDKAYYLLNNSGILYLVHRADRVFEINTLCTNKGMMIKKCVFISTNNKVKTVLLKIVKNGKAGTKISTYNNLPRNLSYQNFFEED